MRYKDYEARRGRVLASSLSYTYDYYLNWNYDILRNVVTRRRNGSKASTTYSEAWIMLDTETSRTEPLKKGFFGKYDNSENYIVAFTCSIRIFERNVCTLRGSKPSEVCHMLKLIRSHIAGDRVYIFVHNLAYDWQFLRRFLIAEFGPPKKQLNIKSHYPMLIQFDNGLVLRDSLILAGCSIEKWGENLGVSTRKAVGCWDYDKIRHQNTILDENELKYIECDTLTGVECLNELANQLNNTVVDIPFTSTGIVRREVQVLGRKNYAKQLFNKQPITFEFLTNVLHEVCHGGYTHANRHIVGWIIDLVTCMDFKSAYPYSMLTEEVPLSQFIKLSDPYKNPEDIYNKAYQNAYIFKFVVSGIKLRDPLYPMPPLQASKCLTTINDIRDNGRIREADYIEIWLNEVDFLTIYEMYEWSEAYCVEVYVASKGLMPKWFRDEIFTIFKDKCELEYEIKVLGQGDKTKYNLKKAQLNSLYGMCVTFPIRPDIIEVYEPEKYKGEILQSGDYYEDKIDMKKKFEKYMKDWKQVLPYVYGVYCTSWAQRHLFELSKCIDDINYHWLYSDTDSIYSDRWNMDKLTIFNQNIKDKLIQAGYGPVKIEDREFWLGIAELDGTYDRFITQGAKRYAVEVDGHIKITVAGVPKKSGGKALKSLEDFTEGYIFHGEDTGKKLSTYFYSDIHLNEYGDECADYIDLTPTDYRLSVVPNDNTGDLEGFIFNDDMELVQIQYYEDKE